MRNLILISICCTLVLAARSGVNLEDNTQVYEANLSLQAFNKADKNKDQKLTPEDENGWRQWKKFDSDGDQVIKKAEFLDLFQPEYAPVDADTHRHIVYKRVNGDALHLDLYFPRERSSDPAPLSLYIHGGGWASGSKEHNKNQAELTQGMLDQGIICASLEYRRVRIRSNGEEISTMRDAVIDCFDGLRFLNLHAAQLGIDMERVICWGTSAGGHLSHLVAWSQPDKFIGDPQLAGIQVAPLRGAINNFGPTDFRHEKLFIPDEGINPYGKSDHWAQRVCYVPRPVYDNIDAEHAPLFAEMSPVCQGSPSSPPVLHFHGDRDGVIPVHHAYHLREYAAKQNLDAEVIIMEGAGHGFSDSSKPSKTEVFQRIQDFAATQLSVP
ncbi:alpha/beta hydrolase [Pontiellaceae bacterium B12227]|nr:alpha/beta hydrolase [Pontiellaceae bacterium B12227]